MKSFRVLLMAGGFLLALQAQSQAADFITGVGLNFSTLTVKRPHDNGTVTSGVLHSGLEYAPGVVVEFGKSGTKGLGVSLQMSTSQIMLKLQAVELIPNDNSSKSYRSMNLGTQVHGTTHYAVVPVFYAWPTDWGTVVTGIFYGRGFLKLNGEVYLTENCSAVRVDSGWSDSSVNAKIRSTCEKVQLSSFQQTEASGVQLELRGSNWLISYKATGPKASDSAGGVYKTYQFLEQTLFLGYLF